LPKNFYEFAPIFTHIDWANFPGKRRLDLFPARLTRKAAGLIDRARGAGTRSKPAAKFP